MNTENEVIRLQGRVHFVGDIVVMDRTQRQLIVLELNNKYQSKIGFNIWANNCGKIFANEQIRVCISVECKEVTKDNWVNRVNAYYYEKL